MVFDMLLLDSTEVNARRPGRLAVLGRASIKLPPKKNRNYE